MATEAELLARLQKWVAGRRKPPTVLEVIETGDGELFAAFVLEAFRQATRDAVVDHMANDRIGQIPDAANPVMRVFEGLAKAWQLTDDERLALLGLQDRTELERLLAAQGEVLPIQVVERVSTLLGIFKAINILLPVPARADQWMRRPNLAPPFCGRSAMAVMCDGGIEALLDVRRCLEQQTSSAVT